MDAILDVAEITVLSTPNRRCKYCHTSNQNGERNKWALVDEVLKGMHNGDDCHGFGGTTIGYGGVNVDNIEIPDIAAVAIRQRQRGHRGARDWPFLILGYQVFHGWAGTIEFLTKNNGR